MAINFEFSKQNSSHFGKVIGTPNKFLIGRETVYQGNSGLFNVTISPGLSYKPEDYEAEFGFWAYFITPTAMCESQGSFFCLNTYDRAKFTFSFMQYAAHVPNGDFVIFLRKLLGLDLAREYFPRLQLKEGKIHYLNTNGTLSSLEPAPGAEENTALMKYLNPSLDEIEFQELITAARFVHWAMNDPAHRKLQVEVAISLFKNNMAGYARQYNLDGVLDEICLVICDIRHQGRARSSHIISALNTNGNTQKALQNLLELGRVHYPERIKTLKTKLQELKANGHLGTKKYHLATKDFVNL
ncbi:hypothetical protein [Runella salmonicolor]|uniref:Uncharacterized protein n=1 Tax=Runella salmonicolor TaxID=2950278 RepID=A0ABT1FML8_9BACT|nr:hypothetical protein [Runella salmonicolor]MCP1382994.1 hypothetical protein [Runella salmonicolor]